MEAFAIAVGVLSAFLACLVLSYIFGYEQGVRDTDSEEVVERDEGEQCF